MQPIWCYVRIDIHKGLAYCGVVNSADKPIVWMHGEIKTPPFSEQARIEAGVLLRRIQRGERIGMPHARPMPSIGPRCHELRIRDKSEIWRIVFRLDADALIILEVFSKKTRVTPKAVINTCKQRIRLYDEVSE